MKASAAKRRKETCSCRRSSNSSGMAGGPIRRMSSKVSRCRSSLLLLRNRLNKGSERPASWTSVAWAVVRIFASFDMTRLAQSRTELLERFDLACRGWENTDTERMRSNVQRKKYRMGRSRLEMRDYWGGPSGWGARIIQHPRSTRGSLRPASKSDTRAPFSKHSLHQCQYFFHRSFRSFTAAMNPTNSRSQRMVEACRRQRAPARLPLVVQTIG